MSTTTIRPTSVPSHSLHRSKDSHVHAKPVNSITSNSTSTSATSSSPSSTSSANDQALTPSIEAIWKSFVEKGHDDVELLKLLLLTKSKEDEVSLHSHTLSRLQTLTNSITFTATHCPRYFEDGTASSCKHDGSSSILLPVLSLLRRSATTPSCSSTSPPTRATEAAATTANEASPFSLLSHLPSSCPRRFVLFLR